ncbi:TetR family transcriptional regulator C-terminal domain-containing protein [Phaeobacter gallaeciensis]|uniref:TetR family transcriptional regulator C-terminal domain-containing protein n=1 Tax=Phaeobacter gallaeciensis TaxID=60890 RepID=UPI00237F0188|nr:TetR family transcriptional regulator C-terminal domain-containing protein [Phaeobacter gallaeciensis]MDE4192544.1 TetR family transcriptional regulator C-terminal domain-containing protein [Phaeobacter gallaeciensis]MDE4200989.1 TetR family transcriptional regulator C-terminal domain-containing protein [Phaeobacter gallaeciensis]MDE4205142.1 TetR family transcriptional regulator C-terminal domain-containing protein [Phaeobacter gallaeciensis]MDE4209281.1 TetR family transcriptional regulato
MPKDRSPTRIQKKNRAAILDAALEVFSTHGFRGATVDQIAGEAGLSKPNLLYYFPSKEAIFTALLSELLDTWLDPLRELDPEGEPLEEMLAYVQRKLQMSQDFPRESRLFANEIVQGAPRMLDALSTDLKQLVEEKAAVIQGWMDAGKLQPSHPKHLIFSIWSLTQHYADFDVQVRTLMGEEDPFEAAPAFLDTFYRRMLTPTG